jgi:general secretion pathway protein D
MHKILALLAPKLAAVALCACFLPSVVRASQAPGAAPAGQDPALPAIQIEGDYYVLNFSEGQDDEMNLEQFIKICYESTGRNFTYSNETRTELANRKVRLFGTKRIPKSDFYAFFQIMMFINDFGCIEVGPPHLAVIVVQNLSGAGGRGNQASGMMQKPIYVQPEDLPLYEDQPAVLIRTLLHLPNTDVRQLSNNLQRLTTTGNPVESAIQAGQTNAIILTGFGSNIAAMAKLLVLVDQASRVDEGIEPVFDVLPMEFAAAEDVAEVIEELLEARNKAFERNRAPQQVTPEGVTGGSTRNTGTSKILIDKRTNSLLVMAMPDDMPRIKDLVARLDVQVIEPERNYHIYALENVKAEELADVLDQFLSDAERLADSGTGTGGRAPTAGGAGGGGGSASNEVIVAHDEATNSLLIAANKTRYEEVLDLVRQLDRRQDQVLIETALIELTGTGELDIGVELGLADVEGDGGFGITSFGLSSFVDTDDDGIPDVKQPALLPGVTGGILDGEDFALPVLVRLFSQRTDTNVLNVPSVLVNNNGSATVTTKDEQPTTTITATGGVSGQTQENFNSYQEAGIVLTISPSISASRYLRLGISLKVSNFTGTFSGSIPPPRTTRELTTIVNVPDGDTMVIGGIITDNKQHTRRAVPWLGDIPILGMLFRRDSDSSQRTTLYFFVTPHILHDRDFADLAEISYKKKLAAAEVIGEDRMRIVDEGFGDPDGAPSLSGFEIPLYRSPGRGEVSPKQVGLDPLRQSELLEQEKQKQSQTPPPPLPAPQSEPVPQAPVEARVEAPIDQEPESEPIPQLETQPESEPDAQPEPERRAA